jgi:integrase
VAELRAVRPPAPDADFVFANGIPSMETFRADLAAANIPELDASGREVVFHCFRNTLATQMARSNVPLEVAKEVMRHSDARLTKNVYTDCTLVPTADVLDKLPPLVLNTLSGDPPRVFIRRNGVLCLEQ